VIQDGEGFILIKKGKPLFFYFKHGTMELKGNTALDYFNSHPVIDFNLCKYNPDEFAWALKLCNLEDHEKVVFKEMNASVPVSEEPTVPFRPADPPVVKPVDEKRIPEPDLVYPKEQRIETRTIVSEPVFRQPTLSSRPADPPVVNPVDEKRIPAPVAVSPRVHTLYKRAVVPQPADGDDTDITILSQIREIDGIVAVSVFNDNRFVITVGDTDSEALLKIARAMLATAKKVTPRPTWGPFVHMTIELPAGNMIIAPYRDNYLCLLTTRTINIGHIRRILRDLQRKSAIQCVI
jgi:hypothetical protein